MSALAPTPGGFVPAQLHDLLERACADAGLSAAGAVLLRGHTNAVFHVPDEGAVVKIARRGTSPDAVRRTVALVEWLTELDFPTVSLHPIPEQPIVVDGHPVTFWTYLPQTAQVKASQIAPALHALHQLPAPPVDVQNLDVVAAIRSSLAATTALPVQDLTFLADRVRRLEHRLDAITFQQPSSVITSDPQHRNALLKGEKAVLCDWDSAAWGQPEWDLVTIEIHCRRFGFPVTEYQEFAREYGYDITTWAGYPILRDLRELRMITTNARKIPHAPSTLDEIRHRINGLRHEDPHATWNIL